MLFALIATAGGIPFIEIPSYENVQASELIIHIQLFEDESYIVQTVEPESLRSYAEEYLYEHGLNKLLTTEQSSPGQKELSIQIIYIQVDEPPLSSAELKELIDQWILQQREADSGIHVFEDWSNPMASEVLLYNAASGAVGLTDVTQKLFYHGFELAPTAIEPYLRLAWQKNMGISKEAKPYPYEPLFSSIHAGMGEYDNRFAIFRLAKNQLLGKKDLYYALDLQVANGQWLGQNNAQTSMRHQLKLPFKAFDLNVEYTSFAQDLSSLSLQATYPLTSHFVMERSGEYAWAELSNKYLNLSFLRSREALKSALFPASVKSLSYQLKAHKSMDIGSHALDASWLHQWQKSDYTFALQTDYQDKASLAWRYTNEAWNAQLHTELFDLKKLCTDASIGYAWQRFRLSGGWEKHWAKQETAAKVSDIFNPGAWLEGLEVIQKEDGWLQLDGVWKSVEASLRAGQKTVYQSLSTDAQSFAPYYLGLGAKLSWDLMIAKLSLTQNFLYMNADAQMRNAPNFRGFGELKIMRDLAHDNSIYAAISYLFHTDYRTLYQPSEDTGFALIADARVGVRISKAFEIEAQAKNLGNNYIFGQLPIPISLYASLKWYFVN